MRKLRSNHIRAADSVVARTIWLFETRKRLTMPKRTRRSLGRRVSRPYSILLRTPERSPSFAAV
jgi:hypothetical protein